MKAKVSEITPTGTWTAGDGTVFYKFDIKFDNGDLGSFLQKSAELKYQVGQEVQYEIEKNEKGYSRVKFPAAKKEFTRSGAVMRSPEEEQKRQLWIVRQSSLKAATDLVSNGKLNYDEILVISEIFTQWVMGERNAELMRDIKSEKLPF